MSNLVRIAAVLSSLLCVGCGGSGGVNAAKAQPEYFFYDDILMVDGRIDPTLRDQILKTRPSKISITSLGGMTSAGLDAADIIVERGIDVEVREYCLSACAYIFLAARKRMVGENSVVGFHNSSSTLMLLAKWIPKESGLKPSLISVSNAVREKQLYASKGIDLNLLFLPDLTRGMPCYVTRFPIGSVGGVQIAYDKTIYFPSGETLSAFGVDIKGSIPEGEALRERVNAVLTSKFSNITFSYDTRTRQPQEVAEVVRFMKPSGACLFMGG